MSLWRALAIAVLGTAVLAMVVGLGLSDRAPAVLDELAGPITDVLRAIADRLGIDTPDWWADVEREPDRVVHVAQWAAVTFVAGLLAARAARVLPVALLAFVASVVIEELQERLTDTRAFEPSDIAANALGVVVGAIAAWIVLGGVALVRRG